MSRPIAWSKTVTFFEDDWHEGNVPMMGPRTHVAWLCSSVFDGARAFEGVAPDLDLHCARQRIRQKDVPQAAGSRRDLARPRA
jgi:branched-chain amino acid aminotransferase